MPIVSEDELAQQAKVDPWTLLSQLQHGDPGEIESLSAAFYKAGGHSNDAQAASRRARTYVTSGYSVRDTSPVDYGGETALADKHITDQATRTDHLLKIAKILSTVGTDLQRATSQSKSEVGTLNAVITKIDGEWETFWQGIGHHLPEDDWQPVRQSYIDQEVAAVRTHGGVVKRHVTSYESTLHSSLKSMADLGYIPPDAVDEGPGDVDLTTGNQDGQTTINAAKGKNGAQLRAATFKLQLINAAIKANGGHVSDAEYAYLYDYYNTTVKHSDVIDNALKGDRSLQTTVGRRFADGLLNLSQGSEQTDDEGTGPYVDNPHGVGTFGRGGYDGLPPNLKDILDSRIGEKGPTPKSGSTDPTGGPDILRAVWKDGHWEIPNYANDTGFGDLLGYADKDVSGSDSFSKQLATTAIHWKQDIDAVQQNTTAWAEQGYTGLPGQDQWGQLPYPPPKNMDPFNLPISDSGASGLLTAASHNQVASAEILLDPTDRHAILGLPWQGRGAERLIDVGTAPDPNNTMIDPNHPGKSLRDEAALAVVKDAGSHYQDFAKIVSNPVKSALTQLAVTHLSSFGQSTGDQAGSSVGLIDSPDGRIHGLSLNDSDASSFLKLVSLSGPKYAGVLHAAALDLGAKWLDSGVDAGTGHGSGADHAATLIGRVTSSEYAAAQDAAAGKSGDEQKAYIAEIREEQEKAQKEALQKGVMDLVDTGLSIATWGASDHVADAIDKISFAMDTVNTANDDYGGYVDAGENTPEQNRLIQIGADVQQALTAPQDSAQVQTNINADLNYMALRASGYAHPDIAYTGTADQINHVVDPALNHYYGTGGAEGRYATQAANSMLPDPKLDPQQPTVDWHDPGVRRAVNGGDNQVYDAPLDKTYGLSRSLKDVTPK